MAVCANRLEDGGMWTPCRRCQCGADVKAEVEAGSTSSGDVSTPGVELALTTNGPERGVGTSGRGLTTDLAGGQDGCN